VLAWARWPQTRPTIPPDEDEPLHARRLVAQRCLYGVDRNPRAVDLAKLSLWLATLARDHEFTFLDHALKCGDSLVGLDDRQIAAMHWDASKPGLPLFRKFIADRVAELASRRAEIQAAPDDTMRVILEAKHRDVETVAGDVRVLGDAVLSAFFSEDKPKARKRRRIEIESWVSGVGEAKWESLQAAARSLTAREYPIVPFHWQVEFPEVFYRDNPGFDVFIGNPPYLGGSRISSELSNDILVYLLDNYITAGDKTDLALYFFGRAFCLLRDAGIVGFVSTNTIAQGDSRSTLRKLKEAGLNLFRAVNRLPWPGDATVVVSVLHLSKGIVLDQKFINNERAYNISVYLKDSDVNSDPQRLTANIGYIFEGFGPYGSGFIISKDDADYEAINEGNGSEIIFKYIGGEDVLNSPIGESDREIIFIGKMSRDNFGQRYPAAYSRVERTVRPERLKKSARVARMPWWQFLWPRPDLRSRMVKLETVFVRPRVAKHHVFMRVPSSAIVSNSANVICSESFGLFAAVQARPHELWARAFSSSMKDDLRYTPSDCFETFPFPPDLETSPTLESAGEAYHEFRASLMVEINLGMTKTYNRFHDAAERSKGIVRLRELHTEMDRAALSAYGWYDLAGRAEPIFLDDTNEDDHTYQGRLFWPSDFRDEVLARLLALNAERAKAERDAGFIAADEEEMGEEGDE
jgi:hypothetical protein